MTSVPLNPGHGECNKALVCSVQLQSAPWLHEEPIYSLPLKAWKSILNQCTFLSSAHLHPGNRQCKAEHLFPWNLCQTWGKGICCSAEMCHTEKCHNLPLQLQWPVMIKDAKTFRLGDVRGVTQLPPPVFLLASSVHCKLRKPANFSSNVYEPSLNTANDAIKSNSGYIQAECLVSNLSSLVCCCSTVLRWGRGENEAVSK